MQPPANPQLNYHQPQFMHNPQQSLSHIAPSDLYMPYQQSHQSHSNQNPLLGPFTSQQHSLQNLFFGRDDAWTQEGMVLPQMRTNDFPPNLFDGTYLPDDDGEGEGVDRGRQSVGNPHIEDNYGSLDPNSTLWGPATFYPHYPPQPPQQVPPNPPQLFNPPAGSQCISDFSIAAAAAAQGVSTTGVSADEVNHHLANPTYQVRNPHNINK